MAWQAKPGCADHHRAAVECMVNALPVAWLLEHETGEEFRIAVAQASQGVEGAEEWREGDYAAYQGHTGRSLRRRRL